MKQFIKDRDTNLNNFPFIKTHRKLGMGVFGRNKNEKKIFFWGDKHDKMEIKIPGPRRAIARKVSIGGVRVSNVFIKYANDGENYFSYRPILSLCLYYDCVYGNIVCVLGGNCLFPERSAAKVRGFSANWTDSRNSVFFPGRTFPRMRAVDGVTPSRGTHLSRGFSPLPPSALVPARFFPPFPLRAPGGGPPPPRGEKNNTLLLRNKGPPRLSGRQMTNIFSRMRTISAFITHVTLFSQSFSLRSGKGRRRRQFLSPAVTRKMRDPRHLPGREAG